LEKVVIKFYILKHHQLGWAVYIAKSGEVVGWYETRREARAAKHELETPR